MEEKIITFEWYLDNNSTSIKFIKSPLFPYNNTSDEITSQDLWFLKLTTPMNDCLERFYNFSICLARAEPKYYFWTEFELKFQFKSEGAYSISRHKNLFHIISNPEWTMKDFTSSYTLKFINQSFGPIKISCRLKIQIEEYIIYSKEIPELRKMFNNKEYSDFTISTTNREFHVHKAIIAGNSEVFAAMFQNEMKEKKEGLVKITDFDDKVVEEFLRYIYCGKVEDLDRLSEDLLKIADKYSVQGLKNICLEEMCKKITTENALKILSLIDYHEVKNLKTFVTNFIIINLKNIDESHFKSLNSDLMLDIFFKIKNFIL